MTHAEDRTRRLYEERDQDPNWGAQWSAENPTARWVAARRVKALRRDVGGLAGTLGEPCSWRVLEVGCGGGGWLPWMRDDAGVPETQLAGIDLSEGRIASARGVLPQADMRSGSAAELPWADASFDVVIASTLFSSVTDAELRARIAAECLRVLRPGGAILWYDMRDDFLAAGLFRRMAQPAEVWLGRAEIGRLFPGCALRLHSATLFVPLARPLVRVSARLATFAERLLPFLRGHWEGTIRTPPANTASEASAR